MIDIMDTSKQGTIEATCDQLVTAFGEPTEYKTGKVDFEWRIRFPSGTIATIYNYKTGPAYGVSMDPKQITHWSVGGHSADAVKAVQEELAAFGFECVIDDALAMVGT
jgi:hypothetical protein